MRDWRTAWASPRRANWMRRPGCRLGAPPHLHALHLLARAVTPPPSPIRFNARFFAVDARHVTGTLGGDGELEGLRYYAMQEALALDLAMPTRRVLERLRLWLAMERGGARGADPYAGDAPRPRLADGVAAFAPATATMTRQNRCPYTAARECLSLKSQRDPASTTEGFSNG